MRSLPLLGWLALAGLTITPPSLYGSAGPEARQFDGKLTVTREKPLRAGRWLVPRDRWTLSGGWPFGGLSALSVSAAGDRLVAIADTGRLVTLRPRWGSTEWPVTIRWLPTGGSDGRGKSWRDSESLARTADGEWWIGFEKRNELRRYDAPLARLTGRYRSAATAKLSSASGLEALAALPDGRLLGIAEMVKRDGRAPAFLWSRDRAGDIVAERPIWFRPPDGYRATDAVALDGERLLVLVRRFDVPTGFSTALVLVPLAPRPGFGADVLSGEVVADFGTELDNAEGLALSREAGRTVVWIVSDDNRSGLQRTMLARWWWTGPEESGR